MTALIATLLVHRCLLVSGFLLATVLGVKSKREAAGVAYLLGSGLVTVLFLLNHWLFGLSLGLA